jgi:hypothetical protein
MSNVVRLRPRPPTIELAMNSHELRLILTALDVSDVQLRRHAPSEKGAQFGVAMLRTRLAIALADLEHCPREPPA